MHVFRTILLKCKNAIVRIRQGYTVAIEPFEVMMMLCYNHAPDGILHA